MKYGQMIDVLKIIDTHLYIPNTRLSKVDRTQ